MRVALFGGRVVVYILGRPVNHRIDPTAPNEAALAELRRVCEDSEAPVWRIFSPKPVFGAEVVMPGAFMKGRSHPLFSNCSYLNGRSADGVFLAFVGDAYRVASADCHTLVLFDELSGNTVAVHTGRDNLIDRDWITTGRSRRFFSSIVEFAVHELKVSAQELGRFFNKARVHALLFAGIAASAFEHPYDHPIHGQYHRLMVAELLKRYGGSVIVGPLENGRIDIAELVRIQLEALGIRNFQRDAIDTYGDKDSEGNHLWWSNRRGDHERNLVLVVRNK